MKIVLLAIGKTDASYFREAIDLYVARLGHYTPFELVLLPDLKQVKHLSEEQQKRGEGELLLKAFQPGDHVVLLDDKGKSYSSMQFADYIERKQHTLIRRLLFVIGGPYGFSPDVYAAAQERLSLSTMTFSHQMVRLIFVEQLYRAFTILKGEPYHHE